MGLANWMRLRIVGFDMFEVILNWQTCLNFFFITIYLFYLEIRMLYNIDVVNVEF